MLLSDTFKVGRLRSSGSDLKETGRTRTYPCSIWMLVACALCLWGVASSGWAQSPDAEKRNDGVPEMAEIVRLKDAVGEARARLRKALSQGRTEGSDGQMEERTAIADRLDATEAAYDRLISALDKDKAYGRDLDQLRERVMAPGHSGLGPPPFNLSFLDRLLGELAAVEQQKETGVLAVNLSRRNVEERTRRLEQSRKELRAALDSGAVFLQESAPTGIQNTIEGKQVEKGFQQALLWQEKAHLENLEKQKEIAELKTRHYGQQIAWVRERVGFDAEDLDSHLKKVLENRNQLQERLQKLRDEQAALEKKLRRLQPKDLSVETTALPVEAGAALKAQEAWQRAIQEEFEQVEDMLRLNRLEEAVWKNRYELVRGKVSQEQLAAWKSSVESHLEGLNRLVSLQQKYQTSLQAEMAALEKQLATPDLDNRIRGHWISQQKALRQQADRRFDYLAAILGNAQLQRHFRDEILDRLDQRSWFERAREIGAAFGQVWNLEVMVIDDRPVTISKITVALMIFVIGILLSRYIVRLLVHRLLQLTALKATTASTLQKMMSYSAYLLVLLLALRMVNIPLAAFAFLGGAIAIGLGFGAQNLINNFISGFILMGEQPIKIGDLIDIDGVLGQVEEVGARCTRVRTGENIHILVPNSSFLEKNITNWTLSDQLVRAHVTVGVIYGSPADRVKDLLIRSVRDTPQVLNEPEPFVIFNDFGDNALIFEVYFWIRIQKVIQRRMIESTVRFTIDRLFADAGIVIAFPQRDVHLDTQRPLELRLVDSPPKA